jgi:hypothetical protein
MSTLAITSEITISDIEKTVQDGLEALRNAPLNDQITAALKFLTPHGYRPVAQLEEDGRKKRSTAAASNWNPATGEIVIYFEPISPSSVVPITKSSAVDLESGTFGRPATHAQLERLTGDDSASTPSEVTELQLQQCCEALAEAEKAGKAFIALKWFRDNGLMSSGHPWADSLAHRQAVVTKAIDAGAIITSSIPNPKAPQHPTTTVKLNRESEYAKTVTRRFQPIRPRGGQLASEIILRDRGRL